MHRGILHQIVNILHFFGKKECFGLKLVCFEGERKEERKRKGIKNEIREKKFERKRKREKIW